MRRVSIALCAVVLGASAFGTAQAAPRGSYVAALATPLPAPRQEIVEGILWKCAGERCAAPSEGSRPVLVCQRVARTFGTIARFTTPSGDLSSEALSRCNGQN